MKQLLALLSTLIISIGSYGKNYTGNDLLEFCTDEEGSFGRGLCAGLLIGKFYGNEYHNVPEEFCVPDNVTLGQISKVITKTLEENPSLLHYGWFELSTFALKQAFPCEDGQ